MEEIRAKSIIVKSGLPDTNYVINPYVGCTHSRIHCYARLIKKSNGDAKPWSEFVDVKIDAYLQQEVVPVR